LIWWISRQNLAWSLAVALSSVVTDSQIITANSGSSTRIAYNLWYERQTTNWRKVQDTRTSPRRAACQH
jgi:hypothetical protein